MLSPARRADQPLPALSAAHCWYSSVSCRAFRPGSEKDITEVSGTSGPGSIPGRGIQFGGGSSFQIRASRDHDPPPTLIRKSKLNVIAKSVRASLTMNQKPWLRWNSSGILVVAIAVRITSNNGMLASLVTSPTRPRNPQITANAPTKRAVKAGIGNPMRVSRSTPSCGSMYFRIPWVKKINPTAMRMNAMLRPFDERPGSDLRLCMDITQTTQMHIEVRLSFSYIDSVDRNFTRNRDRPALNSK